MCSTNPRAKLRFDDVPRCHYYLSRTVGLAQIFSTRQESSRAAYSRLAGYEDTNDAERLPRTRDADPRPGPDNRPHNTMSRSSVLTQDGNVEGLDRTLMDGAVGTGG